MSLEEELEKRHKEIKDISSRFIDHRESFSMDPSDCLRYDQLVLEIRDLLKDRFPEGDYHKTVILNYEQGKENFLQLPSHASVVAIGQILGAAIVRAKRAPLVQPPTKRATELPFPEKFTYKTLRDHVPISWYVPAAGALAISFTLGFTVGKWFNHWFP